MNKKTSGLMVGLMLLAGLGAEARQVIEIKPEAGDMTPVVRAALEGVSEPDIKLVLSKGTYFFRPDYASEKYCFITNHDNGLKKIAFLFDGFESVEIEGNGAELLFHGQMMPFLFENCGKVTTKNLTIDWDIPFCFQAEVVAVNEEEGWRDVKPFTKGYSWKVQKDQLIFPDVDGASYAKVGSTLAFDPATKNIAYGAWDFTSEPTKVEKRKDGILRFYEKLKHYPKVGTILNSKGKKNRYAPAFHCKSSSNILFDGVVIHHALGMGFLLERCDTGTIANSGIYVREGSDRVVSVIADGTHFANCKGDVVVENCRFKGMLDDSTNVHGTYVEVDKVLDEKTVRVKLVHFQQLGFEFAGVGDKIWFIHQPDPTRGAVNKVTAVKVINDRFIELTLKKPIPSNLKAGDVLENKTWNPTFTMRGNHFEKHRARNVVIKTPLPVVIENNDFSSHMSAVFLRGETYYWFESGNVEDVLIKNNRFKDCASSGMEHSVMYVTPRLGKTFDASIPFDRNIRFIDNTIETYDNRIIWLDRVDGFVFKGNTIKQTKTFEPQWNNAYLFDFKNCRNVQLIDNIYVGSHTKAILADDATKATLTVEGNKGF
ncbi:right-handed parallel beta-helix repeat-containing protein [Pontiella sulfatireligans]|uniref:Alpha-1,3-galactosidase B n=1 Tax=Pontiella sulfatireligans TaxID=2750658 RepID=A0A6C2UMB7_9BACT|nr:right-handed parallel beta-helix repeat-containing protein [Pontiella sulfatireligans]VGO20454.1 Alpha-1,3-galactosidase B [Pontiella sulfatireligans]